MSLQQAFTKAKTHLKTARQRAVFIFSPEDASEREQLSREMRRLTPAAVYFSDKAPAAKPMHRYRDALGQTHSDIVLDYHELIHADALAALAGTVAGGGIIWLLLPTGNSAFKSRLLTFATDLDLVRNVGHWHHLPDHLRAIIQLKLPSSDQPQLPSAEQQRIISNLRQHQTQTHIVLADRGRGKSTALGLAVKAAGYCPARPILVTAPQPQAAATLIEYADGGAQFRAWDRLLNDSANFGSKLIIDEAAAIPLHILKRLQHHYQVWAIATTVDGYEGCGKGFALRFLTWLKQTSACQHHKLTEALRWSDNDSVEAWLSDFLMLRHATLKLPQRALAKPRWVFIQAHELSDALLKQVMGLLLEAHYQSSPNDLRLLLDDAQQQLGLILCDEILIGVCWIALEGPIPSELKAPILHGERRVKGQLLPQALAFYRQQSACLAWRWMRVVRIASHPELLRQGIASSILTYLQMEAEARQIDALGTSFGLTPEVEAFWETSAMLEIRRGQKKNIASGEVSTIWAQGLTAASQHLVHALGQLQQAEQAWLQGQPVAADLPVEITLIPILRGFSEGFLPLSNARFAWWYMLHHHPAPVPAAEQPRGLFDPSLTIATVTQLNQAPSRAEFENRVRESIRNYLRKHPVSS